MRLIIRHESIYRYEKPILAAIQRVRKTPRNDGQQFIGRWRIDVDADADCHLKKSEDAFGNITHMFSIDGPLDKLTVLVEGEVETQTHDGIIRDTAERLPLAFWRRPSFLTVATPKISQFARDLAMAEGGDRLAAAHAISRFIHQNFAFIPGETDTTTTADAVLAAHKGVCQDFSHLFIAAMRALGNPARYVSGYIQLPEREDQIAGHAWAETHIEGLGWVSFDPANDLSATERHVRVAVAPDYNDAAPIRGAQQGGGGESLDIKIAVTVKKPFVEMGQEQ
jgi:transglutaminase-like putative cysteine protease